MTDRRIYVASLSDYNAGRLHGAWIDCDSKTAEELQDEVSAMLAKSPEPIAEEYAIHDHEGFGDLIGEYSSLREIAAICNVLDMAEGNGIDPTALIEWCDDTGRSLADASVFDDFEDAYSGQWNSTEDFAEQLADDIGMLSDCPDNLRFYFDWEAFARDLFMTDYHMTDSGHVFRNI